MIRTTSKAPIMAPMIIPILPPSKRPKSSFNLKCEINSVKSSVWQKYAPELCPSVFAEGLVFDRGLHSVE